MGHHHQLMARTEGAGRQGGKGGTEWVTLFVGGCLIFFFLGFEMIL